MRWSRLALLQRLSQNGFRFFGMSSHHCGQSGTVFYSAPTLTTFRFEFISVNRRSSGRLVLIFSTWTFANCYCNLDFGVTFCSPSNSFPPYCSYRFSPSLSLCILSSRLYFPLFLPFTVTTVKWFQVFPSNTNNSF